LLKKRVSGQSRLLATRLAIPAFGIFSVVVALKIQVVYDLILDSNSIILVCVTVPFIAGVWWKKANRSGALAGMLAGFAVWMIAYRYTPQYPADFLGMLACLVTVLIVTPLTQAIDPPRPVRNNLGEAVELKDRLGTLPLFRRVRDSGGSH
jgi:Na+/proline symporter